MILPLLSGTIMYMHFVPRHIIDVNVVVNLNASNFVVQDSN